MDLETVKACFEKYVSYLKSSEKVTVSENYDINSITIQQIDKITQLLFMDYVVKCDSKINQFSIPCVLYKHVNSLVRNYIQENPSKTNSILKESLFDSIETPKPKIEINDKSEKIEVTTKPAKRKGWFY